MPHQIRLLGDAERVIVQTRVEEAYLAKNGIAPGRLAVVGAGIDPESLRGGDGDAFRQRHHWPGKIITSIGALTLNKGTYLLLEAARRLWMTGYEFKLYLAGPMMDDFRAYWTQLPAVEWDRVVYLGAISETEKRDLLAAADVLVSPSRVESFGIVFLEAWFYGKPVIGADAGAIPDVIEDGTDGRLVPFGDADALARAIAEILDDPELAKRWGENGRRKVMERFTWDAVYSRFMAAQAETNHSNTGDKVMI
jgi:glycosyltransferase involved in cell wall biosynthesis